MIDSHVLVLNRSFLPINITTAKRAFSLLYQGIAKAVNSQYETFDYESWSDLSIEQHDETIGLVDRAIKIPRVILLVTYDRIPKTQVRFTRANIYARDRNTCQYCGVVFTKNELSLDHIIPRAYGGASCWENIVCCCFSCNKKKGSKGLHETGMKLLKPPAKPRWPPFFKVPLQDIRRQEWRMFLNMVDISYWNTELLE
ncbi:MAG: HNH endonuclease [Deltaproteobacteria bacterium CG_4_8_14_3_um_filter_43_13]|nr:MAG: HNH endonuclease [Deltaproteobacteria bacterium CG_4_8_14_3_um_filter_43_13]PIZ20235.1 MAG: HNH endonuclease [Deltaproteobacteria bacterium CG_4_10_14_0_8_um_filter_43_12]